MSAMGHGACVYHVETGRIHQLAAPTAIGCAEFHDIRLGRDRYCDWTHVVLEHRQDRWYAINPSSFVTHFSVWVNELPLLAEVQLSEGTRITVMHGDSSHTFLAENLGAPARRGRSVPANRERPRMDRERYPRAYLERRIFESDDHSSPSAGYCTNLLLLHARDGARELRSVFVRALADERSSEAAAVGLVLLADAANRRETLTLIRERHVVAQSRLLTAVQHLLSGHGDAWAVETCAGDAFTFTFLLALLDPASAVAGLRALARYGLAAIQLAWVGCDGMPWAALLRIQPEAVADLAEEAEATLRAYLACEPRDAQDMVRSLRSIKALTELAGRGHESARMLIETVACTSSNFVVRDCAELALERTRRLLAALRRAPNIGVWR